MCIINGKYYCFKCGAKIVRDHVMYYIKILKERGLIAD